VGYNPAPRSSPGKQKISFQVEKIREQRREKNSRGFFQR
jgi:hypothetical protein